MRVGIQNVRDGGGVTQDQLSSWSDTSSDAELIAAVRDGETAAFGVLYERHAGAARTVARQYTSASGGADDVVADAFAKVLEILTRGKGGPTSAFRAYLFTVVRRLAYVAVNQSRRTLPTDEAAFESIYGPSASSEEPALEKFEQSTVTMAYKALPERWQAALWYSEVEGMTPAQFAPSLGLTANGAAALAYRAREGLRQQYLQQHLSVPPDVSCARTNPLLAGYVRGVLSRRDCAEVERHLETCGECRGLLVELGDVSHGMRAIIAPLVLGTAGVGMLGGLPSWGAAAAVADGAGAVAGAADGGAGGGSPAGASGTGASGTGGAAGSAGSTAATAATAGAAGAVGAGAAAAEPSAAASSVTSGAGVGLAGASSGGGLAGVGTALAGLPALVVTAIGVVVVGAGIAVAAAFGAFSGDPDQPTPAAMSASVSPAPGTGSDEGASPAGPASDPTTIPAPGAGEPDTVPHSASTREPGATAAPAAPAAPTRVPGAAPRPTAPGTTPHVPTASAGPVTTPAAQPDVGSTTEPAREPATMPTGGPEPTTEPAPAPTDPSIPPAAPTALQLSFDPGTEIVARQDNAVAFTLRNTGGTAASDVTVSLTVPETLRFVAGSATSGGVFGPRLLRTTDEAWTCAAPGTQTSTQVVRCFVGEMAPSADVIVTLTFYAEDALTADLAAQVFVGQDAIGEPWPFTSSVSPAPARLSATVAPVAALVAGQPGHLALTVTNVGQLPAADPAVVLDLPPDSGIRWRDVPVGPAPGSAPGWSCSIADAALACGGPPLDGDQSATVIVPVAVAAAPLFTGTVAPTTTFAGAPVPAPAVHPSELAVERAGLAAVSILSGPLQVAHTAAPLGAATRLTVPDVRTSPGLTVREAVLTWSGQDAQGLDDRALATVELRTDAGGFASEQIAGTGVVQVPGPDGRSSYRAAADVTALLADHAQTGRWFLAPTAGARLPADLTWSLTVVYEHAVLPEATVTLLLGAPGMQAAMSGPGPQPSQTPADSTAARPLALPAPGPVRVAVTGTVRGGGDGAGGRDLTVNGTVLAPVAGDPAAVVTYRSDDLLGVVAGARSPLALSLAPGGTAFSVLAVHASAAPDRPEVEVSGVLEQPQPEPTVLAVSVDLPETVAAGDGVAVPVTVRNDSTVDLAQVSVAFALPPGVVAAVPAELACPLTPSSGTTACLAGPLAAAQSAAVTITLTGDDGLVLTGEVGVIAAGADLVTGERAEAKGAFGVTAHLGVGVRGTWHGSVAVTEAGAPLMRCSVLTCWLASSPWWADATNDHLTMRPLNDAAGVASSSSATVTIPAGASVTHAGLYWSANRDASDRFSRDRTSAWLRAPGVATYTPVAGEMLGEVSDSAGRVSYQSYADVTEMVAAHGAGRWSVADVALADRSYGSGILANRDLYAGWALVVVYEDQTLAPGSVTVIDTPVAVTATSALSFDLLDEGATTMTLGAVAWEGDRRVTGDQLQVGSVPVRPLLSVDGAGRPVLGSAMDAFSSVAWGSSARYENSLGVDVTPFEPVTLVPGITTVSAVTTGDEYVIGVVTATSR